MSRKKNILLASTCIVLGMALAGPAAHAAEEFLTAVRSTHQFYLDGEQIELEAYLINGNNYVKLADVRPTPAAPRNRRPTWSRRARTSPRWSIRCGVNTGSRSWLLTSG